MGGLLPAQTNVVGAGSPPPEQGMAQITATGDTGQQQPDQQQMGVLDAVRALDSEEWVAISSALNALVLLLTIGLMIYEL